MVFVNNSATLFEDIERFKQMFPESYTGWDEIKKALDGRHDDPKGSVFGISVAEEWQDMCFGFEIDEVDLQNTHILYLGLWKC